jgi:predicted transposase YbfD/YdcC
VVRSHWSIENNLHWQLDVTFREDLCRLRKGNTETNLTVLLKIALTLLKKETSHKVGVKNKRLSAAVNEEYLAQVLCGQ